MKKAILLHSQHNRLPLVLFKLKSMENALGDYNSFSHDTHGKGENEIGEFSNVYVDVRVVLLFCSLSSTYNFLFALSS